MLTAPYSIYVNKRPLRVAFLIEDKPASLAIIDTILAYNRDRWGGRYNPIVITDGQTFTDAWWSLLEAVDPDVVKSFVTLSDNLVTSIERRISPYLIQQPDPHEQGDGYQRLNLLDEGLTILPTALNVRMVSQAIGEPSLVTPLTELSTFMRAFTYPIQLCLVPKESLPPVNHDRFAKIFHVIIGDTPTDVAYFWNRPATTPQWSQTYLNQIWLPLGVATDTKLTTALSAWLKRSADPNGRYQAEIRFVSLSLSQEQLQKVVEPLTCELRMPQHVNALRDIQPPKIREGVPGPPRQDKMDLYRATGTTERLTLHEPDLPQGPILDGHWMADLYIEFRPERYPMNIGRPLWWQLPRLNILASQMFRRPSRILRTRYPSVLMKRGEPRLDIALLDDLGVFAVLAVLSNQSYYTLDARQRRTLPGRTPYYDARRSEKGRYLSGLLDLFGSLYPATSYLEARYWRQMFDLLSGRTAHKDANRLSEVDNALRKHLGANRAQFYEDDKAMTWLANYVLKVARNLPASSRDLEFSVFAKHAKLEIEDFNARRPDLESWEYSQKDLMRALAGLTECGVLLMGVQARCPSCGYRAWHHIDDAKQTLRCGGCNATFPMLPEPRWHYRLNSLARAALAEHGLLPVVLVLGQLFMDARSAFLFAPCLDVFENDDKGQIGDLDIAVILDGQFVIGEVKQSRSLFDKATFAKMEDIARRLLPDILLFASMDREPTRLITKEIARLSEALRPQSIDVRWYPLHEYKFDASPVR